MSDSEIDAYSSDCSHQGTTEDEEEENEGVEVFSIDEIVDAAGVDFGITLVIFVQNWYKKK